MVGSVADNIIVVLFILSVPGAFLCLLVGWTWWKEGSRTPRQKPRRRLAASAGLAFASASAIAFGGIIAKAQFARPTWPLGSHHWATVSGFGGACGLLGVLLAIAGKGKCRIPGLVASLLQLFWWYGIFEVMYVR